MNLNYFLLFFFFLLAVDVQAQKDISPAHQLDSSNIETNQFNFQSYWSAQNKTAMVYARQQQSVVFQNSGQSHNLDVDWRVVRWKRKKPKPGKQILIAAPFYLLGADRIDESKRRKSDLRYGF